MALILEKIDEAGVAGSYWKLIQIFFPSLTLSPNLRAPIRTGDVGWSNGVLEFALYRDTQARKIENRLPISTERITVTEAFFDGLPISSDLEVMTKAIYARSHLIPELSTAISSTDPSGTPEIASQTTKTPITSTKATK